MTDKQKISQQIIVGIFQLLDLSFFMGGSRRFGYATESSDTDYFVLAVDIFSRSELFAQLESLGFVRTKGNARRYGGTNRQVYCLKDAYHVTVHFRSDDYFERKEQNNQVARLVQDNPDWQGAALAAKQRGSTGSEVYKMLLSHATGGFAYCDDSN